ncbi:MAG: hypothetical protein M3395_12165 [Chloroflexota bacterium]|nr:hypothetical protein [Chloroflexota bacterium]
MTDEDRIEFEEYDQPVDSHRPLKAPSGGDVLKGLFVFFVQLPILLFVVVLVAFAACSVL